MTLTKTWPGGATNTAPTSFSIPQAREVNWASLTNFLAALADTAQATTIQKFAVRVATSSPVTVSASTDCVVVTNLTVAGAVAVNLPTAATKQVFAVVDGKGDAATNNITITPASGTINGAATYVINVNKAGAVIIYDGTEWRVIAEFGATSAGTGTIARNKIAAGTADHVIINSGAGALSSEANLAVTRGGTGSGTAAGARTNLGLGSIATQASSSVTITGGSITGITDLAVADGGTGASDAGTARTNLGLGSIATQASSNVSITGGAISGITDLAVADGGTGASTAAAALNNLLPSQGSNSGKALVTDGTNAAWSAVATDSLAQYRMKIGDSGGTAVAVNTNAVGDIKGDETNGLTIKSGAIDDTALFAAGAEATAANRGLVSTGTQTLGGIKNNASMPAFRADKQGSNQTYNNNASDMQVTWTDSGGNTFDQGAAFDPTAESFTVPTGAGGIYWFSAGLYFTGANMSSGAQYYVGIRKGGTKVATQMLICQGAGKDTNPQVSVVLSLAAGDVIDVAAGSSANHSASTITIDGSAQFTYFAGAKLY